MLKLVTIGGGTGLFTLLSGLKKYPFDLSAIVTVTDEGGSNKKFRDEFGLLPPSDFRQCLVALSSEEPKLSTLRKLMIYRFSKGSGLKGQTFGNILIAALTHIEGSQLKAFEKAGKILNIKGKIIPISPERIRLMAEYENGEVVLGEHLIDEPRKAHDYQQRIKKLFLDKKARIFPRAKEAILSADYIILGPGDLYTSILANLVVKGVTETIRRAQAKIIYIVNLMTKFGQTTNFTAEDHIKEVEKYLGKNLDYVVVNKAKLPPKALKLYAQRKDFPVKDDLRSNHYKVIRANLISKKIIKKQKGDILERSLIRHDSDKLAKVIRGIIKKRKPRGKI